MRRLFAALVVALAAVLPAAAQEGRERILSYDALIEVAPDGALTVTETITVRSAGEDIRHGIFRDFPTSYDTGWGLRERVGFDVIAVERDGEPEPWWTEAMANGVRIYIGSANLLLPPGEHVYRLTYRTDRQIAFLDEVDELAWNVTGNDWAFPIDRVTATVRLPPGAQPIEAAIYTGVMGATGRDARVAFDATGEVEAWTTRPLWPGEGLTVAVSWPKGVIPEPGALERTAMLLGDNLGVVVVLAGLVLTLAYFGLAWHAVGRDPPRGVIFPRFEGPKGFSPVASGYVWNGGFGMGLGQNDAFAIAVTSLAARGYLTIAEERGDYTLTRLKPADGGLSKGEAAVLRGLFASGDRLTLDGRYKPSVRTTVSDLVQAVSSEYGGHYRKSHTGFWLGGVALALVTAAAALVLQAGGAGEAVAIGMFGLFALAFGGAALFMLSQLLPLLARGLRGDLKSLVGGVVGVAFALMFSGPAIFVAVEAIALAGWFVVAAIAVLFAITGWFMHLLKAPTLVGRAVLDELEGYRMYLSVAESGRLDMTAQEPAMTAALFERHLPYAMALGVAEAWADKFEALAGPEAVEQASHPSWYRSSRTMRGLSGLGSALGRGFAGTVASSARAPSSRSGGGGFSSGGGSSGGGGGGGGGGGW